MTPDSEGPGTFRGGFGIEYELEIRHPSAVVVMRGKDRHHFSSWGAAGGGAGATSGCIGTRRGAAVHDIGKRTVYRPELGEVIRLWGGGGFGDPLMRDPAAIAEDVAAGLVSPVRARDVYGVVLAVGEIDAAATQALRHRLRHRPGRHGDFDFGAARAEWERLHGLAAERIAVWLPSLPAGIRRHAQAEFYRRLRTAGNGPYGADTIAAAIGATGDALGHPVDSLRQAAE